MTKERETDPRDIIRILAGQSKFPLGQVVATPGALEQVAQPEIMNAISRHARGDWGELDEEDRQANEESLLDGSRLLSAYSDTKGTKFWIITEADRSVTTVLLPEDY